MIIYLLHFDRPYKHARHYLGCTTRPIAVRLQEHASGNGARLVEVITQAGITWQLARIWRLHGPWAQGWAKERKLKSRHDSPGLCPICNPHVKAQRGYPKRITKEATP
jgi:predicted GIY-YIG superfamily endonuclease